MSNKLIVTDLNKLKITKIKDWAIYFTYDDERYLLHGKSMGYDDYSYDLYKRVLVENNRYELDYITGECTSNDYIKGEFIKDRRTLVYNQIDKEYFVNKLVDWKFAEYNSNVSKNRFPLINKQQYDEIKNSKIDEDFLQECKETSELFKTDKYDYKKNLENLKQQYENKIQALNLQMDYSSMECGDYEHIEGLIEGLEISINDLEDILNGLGV